MSARLHHATLGLALLLTAARVGAAECKHEFAPYLWGSAMDGTVGSATSSPMRN